MAWLTIFKNQLRDDNFSLNFVVVHLHDFDRQFFAGLAFAVAQGRFRDEKGLATVILFSLRLLPAGDGRTASRP